MRKTRASQASSSEKLLRLKQELGTAAELVSAVLKREQLKREMAQQAQDLWDKRSDYAYLKRKFPSLLNPKEDDELLFDKEKVKRPRPTEQGYAYYYYLEVCEFTDCVVDSRSGSSRATTMVNLYLRQRTTTQSFVQRNALQRFWHKSIVKWLGLKTVIITGKTEWRYVTGMPVTLFLLTSS